MKNGRATFNMLLNLFQAKNKLINIYFVSDTMDKKTL